MFYIMSWTTKKHKKNSFQATTFKVEDNSFRRMRRRFAAVFVILHLRYRRGAASLRQRSGAKITVLMCEQKSYPV